MFQHVKKYLNMTEQFRTLSDEHANHEDKLQVRSHYVFYRDNMCINEYIFLHTASITNHGCSSQEMKLSILTPLMY